MRELCITAILNLEIYILQRAINMKFIILEPLALAFKGEDCVRRCTINRVDGDVRISQEDVWFQFSKSILSPDDKDCDSYLLAVVMGAMVEGRDIIVKGSVSGGLLSNLIEYQAAWNKWLPEIYSIIDIKVDSIREVVRPVSGSICAFSGGVDSMFSVWMHSQVKNSYRTQQIKSCTLVHGFDIPLIETVAFSNAASRAATTLDDVGIKIMLIKTNYREISRANWEHAHATALVATLANFKSVAGTLLIGSSYPYSSLIIPWGSTPIIDFLLSSDDFIVMHDGASHTRTEKVKAISEWQVGSENLRVCWEGDLKDRNCGKCEKCVRTQLNFLAIGCQVPNCFDDGDLVADIKGIVISKEGVHTEWMQIIDYAERNGIKGGWVKEANEVVSKRQSTIDIAFLKGSFRRLVLAAIRRGLFRGN